MSIYGPYILILSQKCDKVRKYEVMKDILITIYYYYSWYPTYLYLLGKNIYNKEIESHLNMYTQTNQFSFLKKKKR